MIDGFQIGVVGRDEKSSLQSTKKNAVVDVNRWRRPVENSSLHFSTGQHLQKWKGVFLNCKEINFFFKILSLWNTFGVNTCFRFLLFVDGRRLSTLSTSCVFHRTLQIWSVFIETLKQNKITIAVLPPNLLLELIDYIKGCAIRNSCMLPYASFG